MSDITLTYYETDRGIECGYEQEGSKTIHLISNLLQIDFPSKINIDGVEHKRVCRLIPGEGAPNNWDGHRMVNIFIPKDLEGSLEEAWKAWSDWLG